MNSGGSLPILLCGMSVLAALADTGPAAAPPTAVPTRFKLTPSFYQSSDGDNAWDLNLRANHGPHAGWLGVYRDLLGLRQLRSGYEFTEDLEAGQVVWSAQAADGGFLGGSINAQFGSELYAMVGFGRTNLRPYYNLNFDPNDAITLGLGGQVGHDTDAALYQIWDDRLGTRQHVTHLYLHHLRANGERFSVDSALKRGLDDGNQSVHGYSLTLTYAIGSYFLRVAHDQYANFGHADQNRLSLGGTF